jgi:hypothetical protein
MLAILILSAVSAMSQAAETPRVSINLDRPGAMRMLERDNPEHYQKVTKIRALASQMPCFTKEFGLTLAARYDARDAGCAVLLMTSYPSKRRLTFKLEAVTYLTVIQMDESANRFMLVK